MARAFAVPPLASRIAASHDQLVVFEDLRCRYCSLWEHDVGRIYDKTDEARVLPLRRVDYRTTLPADLKDVAPITYWPTFVVMHCGHEFRRLTGYNGADQFWGLLDNAIRALKAASPCEGNTV